MTPICQTPFASPLHLVDRCKITDHLKLINSQLCLPFYPQKVFLPFFSDKPRLTAIEKSLSLSFFLFNVILPLSPTINNFPV